MNLETCTTHGTPNRKNTEGRFVCSKCAAEKNRARAAAKREDGILPEPCPKCGGARYWSTLGSKVCQNCRGSYHKAWRVDNEENLKEYSRVRYLSKKDEIVKKAKEFRENNKEKIKQRRLEYMDQFDREYWIWKEMNARCHRSTHRQYPDYGARGIFVHEDWRRDPSLSKEENFPRYLSYKHYIDTHLGPRPHDTSSIDRIENNKGYEPGNLRWATRVEQNNNRRNTVSIKQAIPDYSPIYYPYGELITIKDFADKVGIPLAVVKYRYSHNWDAEWILNAEYDGRIYEYHAHRYKMSELCLISGLKFDTLSHRIRVLGMSVKDAVETPHRVLSKRIQ